MLMRDGRDETYASTREAWRRVWQETDVDRELQTRDYARAQQVRRRFLRHLTSEPILEAGCGLGTELVGLADDGRLAIGVDYVTSALLRLKARRRSLKLAAADIHELPFRDGSFAAYLSFGVLEHFEFGPGPALCEAFRVLRTGGVLVLTVPAPNLVWRLVRAKRRMGGIGRADGYYETTYSSRALAAHVIAAGFEVVEQHPIGHDFTLWGCSRVFRRAGYYQTNRLAEILGAALSRVLPWSTSFATLVVARKRG
jgi:SAM-dependent methyltransferase